MTGHTRLKARGQGAEEAFAGCRWERRCFNGCVHGRQKQQTLVTGGHGAGAPHRSCTRWTHRTLCTCDPPGAGHGFCAQSWGKTSAAGGWESTE